MSQPNRPVDKFGFPIPVTFDDVPGARKGFRLPESRHSRRWVGILAAFLVVGVLAIGVWKKARGVFAEMHEAHAMEHYWDENYPAAMAEMDTAISWQPDKRLDRYVTRAKIRLQNRDLDGALTDVNHVIETVKEKQGRAILIVSDALVMRSMVHRRRGESDEAIKDCTTALEMDSGKEPTLLNHRAYYRALANVELDKALVDIQATLTAHGVDDPTQANSEDDAALLDTRGFVFFRLEKNTEALADIEAAIKLTNQHHERIDGMQFPPQQSRYKESSLREIEKNLAVMYEHRGLIQEALGNAEQAKSDHAQAKKLGYDPANGVE